MAQAVGQGFRQRRGRGDEFDLMVPMSAAIGSNQQAGFPDITGAADLILFSGDATGTGFQVVGKWSAVRPRTHERVNKFISSRSGTDESPRRSRAANKLAESWWESHRSCRT